MSQNILQKKGGGGRNGCNRKKVQNFQFDNFKERGPSKCRACIYIVFCITNSQFLFISMIVRNAPL